MFNGYCISKGKYKNFIETGITRTKSCDMFSPLLIAMTKNICNNACSVAAGEWGPRLAREHGPGVGGVGYFHPIIPCNLTIKTLLVQ